MKEFNFYQSQCGDYCFNLPDSALIDYLNTWFIETDRSAENGYKIQRIPYFRPYLTEGLFLSHEAKIVEAFTETGLYRFQDWFAALRESSKSRFNYRDLRDFSSEFFAKPILTEYRLYTPDRFNSPEGPLERVLFIKMCLLLITRYKLLKMIPEPFRTGLDNYLHEYNLALLKAQKPFVPANAIEYD